MLKRLEVADMDAAAQVHRNAFDQALPWLAGLHTPAEDQWFFRERVFKTCEVWGAFERGTMIGTIAFRTDWIDQLYVLPKAQGGGVGTALLEVAQRSFESPAALDVPAQFTGSTVLRNARLCTGPGDRWCRKRGEGARRALCLDAARSGLMHHVFRDCGFVPR